MDEGTIDRLLRKTIADDRHGALSERARQSQRSVENYLKAGVQPRWMERLSEIERATRAQRQRLERMHRALKAEHHGDPEAFAARWTAYARAQDFGALNELIRQHNEWYPIERDLPMDPRTGEYVRVRGRSHHRSPLTAEWVLERFPPRL